MKACQHLVSEYVKIVSMYDVALSVGEGETTSIDELLSIS